MTATAYQKIASQYPTPGAGVAGSGCQQAASASVIGFDAATTSTRNNQSLGAAAAVPDSLVAYDGSVP